MIVELYGLPGAGKSTLAKRLVDEHGFLHITLPHKGAVLGWLLLGLVTKPMWHFWLLGWTLKRNRSLFYVWNFYCQRAAKYTKARFSRSVHVVLDEGVLQNLLSYAASKYGQDEIETYFTCVLDAQQVVVLSPEEHTRQKQLAERSYPGWRQQKLPEGWEETMITNFTLSKEVLRKDADSILLHDSNDVEALLQQLKEKTV